MPTFCRSRNRCCAEEFDSLQDRCIVQGECSQSHKLVDPEWLDRLMGSW